MESMHIFQKIHKAVYLFSLLLLLGSLGLLVYESGKMNHAKTELSITNKNMEMLSGKIEELAKKEHSITEGSSEENKLSKDIGNEEGIQEDMEVTAQEYTIPLENKIQEEIKIFQDDGSLWSVYYCDLKGGGDFALNSNKMQAASLIKLFIMGCVYEDYDLMIIKDTKEQIDEWLKTMITVSDNEAANQLVYVLGGGDEAKGREKVDKFAKDHGYEDTHMGRLLLASNAVDDNYTSVLDCGKFLQDCYESRLPHSDEIQELLKQQTRRQKIPAGIPQNVIVGNKTGELQDVQNDVAIVYIEDYPYLLCVMSQEVKNSDEAMSKIAGLSKSVYSFVDDRMKRE